MEKKVKYSIVVPIFNEEGSIKLLHTEILSILKKISKDFEIIFVNDGSTDDTENVSKTLSPLKLISLRINRGQSSALNTGIKSSKGEILITLDGDGQNDPQDIPRLLEKLSEGFDVVCGWRHKRQDPFTKKLISQGARLIRRILVKDNIHDAGCTLRVYRKECFQDLEITGEMHRMIPAILKWRGYKITEEKVNHRPRKSGKSKYSWLRTFRGLLDMILIWFGRKYENRPLHLFGTFGLFLIFASSVLLLFLAVLRIFFGYQLSDKIWPLVGMNTFISGIQLLILGILADLIIKNKPKNNSWEIKDVFEK